MVRVPGILLGLSPGVRFKTMKYPALLAVPATCCLLLSPTVFAVGPEVSATEPVVTYQRDVLPMLERHCTSCHSGWFPSAWLDLTDLGDILDGGRSGPLVVPGRPDKGWLMFAVGDEASGRQRMPPEGARLSEQEKALLHDWIEQGLRP